MQAYYTADPRRVTDSPRLICTGTERGIEYYAPGHSDGAPSVELVY